MSSAEEIIKMLKLIPHPAEGGFFRETYRAEYTLKKENLPPGYSSDHSFSTAIYYLLSENAFSALHRLKTDEIFHFYLGDPVTMLLLYPGGSHKTVTLGHNLTAGNKAQAVVPRGVWQGSCLAEGGKFALMGTTMAPGFDPEDFETGIRGKLTAEYPEMAEMIKRLTRE